MPYLNDKEYKCDACGGIFDIINDDTWNENKREAEYEITFPGFSKKNRGVICDDCWKKYELDKIVKPHA